MIKRDQAAFAGGQGGKSGAQFFDSDNGHGKPFVIFLGKKEGFKMSVIDRNTVRKVARLARIRVTEAEEETLAAELNKILSMVSQLSEVDTKGVEPLTSVVDMNLPQRPDAITDGGIPEKILSNAPESTAGFFVVPKVVE
jgi:aspartyl-tRNA(Asn)/glutamyl-tRNA(Gln) amidotransferase subunit C